MNGNPFYVAPASLQGLGAGINAGLDKYNAMQEKTAQEQKIAAADMEKKKYAQKKQKDIQGAIASNDFSQIAKMGAKYPEMREGLEKGFKFKSEQTQNNMAEGAARILSGEDPRQVLEERIQFVVANGGDPKDMIKSLQEDTDEEIRKSAKTVLATLGSKQQIEQYNRDNPTEIELEEVDLKQKKFDLEEKKAAFQEEESKVRKKKMQQEIQREAAKIAEVEQTAMSIELGVEEAFSKAPEASRKSYGFYERMKESNAIIQKLQNDPEVDVNSWAVRTALDGGIPAVMANKLLSPKEQSYVSAALDYATAVLRLEVALQFQTQKTERKLIYFFLQLANLQNRKN